MHAENEMCGKRTSELYRNFAKLKKNCAYRISFFDKEKNYFQNGPN